MTTDSLKPVVVFLLAASLLALAGCADKSNPDNVDRRAVERWNDLIAHQAEKAYDYLSPGYRTTQTRENYASAMNNRPVQWKAAKFKNKKCEADRCTVAIDVTYSLTVPNVGKAMQASSVQSETWILVKGAWYFLPK
jgi:hypothetical protein